MVEPSPLSPEQIDDGTRFLAGSTSTGIIVTAGQMLWLFQRAHMAAELEFVFRETILDANFGGVIEWSK